ncbi:MAG: hypothetical protein AAGI03_01120 [Pseudomonadota bacterium]
MDNRPEENSTLKRVLLPHWLVRVFFIFAALTAFGLLFAASDGPDETDVEQSPYRNTPTEVLSP